MFSLKIDADSSFIISSSILENARPISSSETLLLRSLLKKKWWFVILMDSESIDIIYLRSFVCRKNLELLGEAASKIMTCHEVAGFPRWEWRTFTTPSLGHAWASYSTEPDQKNKMYREVAGFPRCERRKYMCNTIAGFTHEHPHRWDRINVARNRHRTNHECGNTPRPRSMSGACIPLQGCQPSSHGLFAWSIIFARVHALKRKAG